MCKAKKPKYDPPPEPKEYAQALEPDQEGAYEEAVFRSNMRGGGQQRSTVLSGPGGVQEGVWLGGQTKQRNLGNDVVLGQGVQPTRKGELSPTDLNPLKTKEPFGVATPQADARAAKAKAKAKAKPKPVSYAGMFGGPVRGKDGRMRYPGGGR